MGTMMIQMTRTTGNVEWYTPKHIVEAVRRVLGEIDLDPCSCAAAQDVVQATRYLDAQDDGLASVWKGTVFMNPPYARGVIGEWVVKLLNANDVPSWITLTNDCMDTEWAHRLWEAADAVCFPRGRIRFDTPDGPGQAPPRGQVLFYRGPCPRLFVDTFSPYGVAALL